MARRELDEINAGSMADIAFLLLVFFLVVTTMKNDKGLARQLPPPILEENPEAPEFYDRDVFEVLVNFNNQLLVEGKEMKLKDLRRTAREFLVSNGENVLVPLSPVMEEFPHRKVLYRKDSIIDIIGVKEVELQNLEAELSKLNDAFDPMGTDEAVMKKAVNDISKKEKEIKSKKKDIDKWLATRYALDYFPTFASLPPTAIISVQNDNSTNYGTYVEINNELEGALNDLRNEVSLKRFDIPFNELDSEDDEDKKKILAIRQVYPQRISEAEPIDVKGFK